MRTADVMDWERRHGRIPVGSVVFIRSDWSKRWPDPKLAEETQFPGVTLEALQFLHEQRHILFHDHEPLDTDTTPNLEGEAWLMHHGYAQAEGVANLDQVPEVGALVAIGYPKFKGVLRRGFIAIVRRTGAMALRAARRALAGIHPHAALTTPPACGCVIPSASCVMEFAQIDCTPGRQTAFDNVGEALFP